MDIGAWELSAALLKALTYAATLGAAGLAFFSLYASPPLAPGEPVRLLSRLCVVALVASALRLPLLAGALAGPSGAVRPDLLLRIAGSGEGRVLLLRTGALLLCAGPTSWPGQRLLRMGGALLAAGSFALTGHVAARHHAALSALLALHLTCAAFWLGALWPLERLLARRDPCAGAVIARFSRLALGVVPVLLLAGLVLAAVLLGSVSALWTSAYGRWLVLKVLLVGVLLALAALNRLRLTARLGTAGGDRALRVSIRAELLVGAGVLAATAALTTFAGPGD